jgi:hypothetical protein
MTASGSVVFGVSGIADRAPGDGQQQDLTAHHAGHRFVGRLPTRRELAPVDMCRRVELRSMMHSA